MSAIGGKRTFAGVAERCTAPTEIPPARFEWSLWAIAVALEAPEDHRVGAPPQLKRTQKRTIFDPAGEAHSISANVSREASAERRPDLSLNVRPSRCRRMRPFNFKGAVTSGGDGTDRAAGAVILESAA